MHRLFVAIDLPEELAAAVCSLQEPIPGAKWVLEGQLHLTLRFVGDADDEQVDRIVTCLSGVVAEPFSLALKGVGCFPAKGAPKVLWVGIDRSEALFIVQDHVEKALRQGGLEADIRSFSPHITIARFRNAPAGLLGPFLQKNSSFASPFFWVTEFVLYSSTLSSQGAVHRPVVHLPLRG